jgi:signal transduction histidine kinase
VSVEALSNVLRHARATRCEVRITWRDALCVEITDDGIGLPERRVPGLGLTAMRRRAAELDGTLEIGPATPRGTVVRLTLGVPAPAGAAR